ncbi:26514_t:CDS:2 [Dentiscutata erythropus]|uniref:26514_t:CDS:1 n=1 Tax=Dentiscutata erythropus TaxID=1348616 RepID=A0A9N9A9G0_9GLOM|nr:26514_t:CDS:2 [Dentiscutata erythropus]
MWLSDTQKIGVGLTAFGSFFMLLGVLLLFDGGLLAIGNILFISGITLIIGVLLVFIKWPVLGMVIELFGFLNLFGDFFPVVISFLRKLPVIGSLLNAPGISQVVDKITGSKLPV